MALRYHPDKQANKSAEEQEEAAQKFLEVLFTTALVVAHLTEHTQPNHTCQIARAETTRTETTSSMTTHHAPPRNRPARTHQQLCGNGLDCCQSVCCVQVRAAYDLLLEGMEKGSVEGGAVVSMGEVRARAAQRVTRGAALRGSALGFTRAHACVLFVTVRCARFGVRGCRGVCMWVLITAGPCRSHPEGSPPTTSTTLALWRLNSSTCANPAQWINL
jgi:hypothetical protein